MTYHDCFGPVPSQGHWPEVVSVRQPFQEGRVGCYHLVEVGVGADFFCEESGGGACVGRIPGEQDRVGLEGFELSCEDFMVGVPADEDHIVEFPVEGQFICV